MNDAEFEVQKERIQTLVERWIKAIGLGWWQIEIKYVRSDFTVDGKLEPNTVASTTANWRYAHACITWNMPNVKEQDDDDLERAFVHELMHIFLDETRMGDPSHEDWIDHEERVASTLAKGFLWLRDSLLEERRTSPLVPNGTATHTGVEHERPVHVRPAD